MDIKVREYRPADFPGILELWKETGIYRPERGDTPEVISRCNALGGRFLVMEDTFHSLIMGTSWITTDGRRSYLHHFAIHPRYQRKGFGRILVTRTMEVLKETGYQVKLEVHEANIVAIHLYRESGFRLLDGYRVYMNRDPDLKDS